MSLFKTRKTSGAVAETPALLFRDLKRYPDIKFLWSHQEMLLDEYHQKHLKSANLAIELPTGSGKTLIGLLLADWRRRHDHERVVYLCPTRQLCNQVHAQAQKYGVNTSLLIGKQKEYNQGSFSSYQRAESIAITTYSGVFNTNPAIDDPQIIICDDAHAAENYIASLWSLRITTKDNTELYNAILATLGDAVPSDTRRRITDEESEWDKSFVDLIPSPKYHDSIEDLGDVLQTYCNDGGLSYSWGMLRGHLSACNIYVSQAEILIRPIIAPSNTHFPFYGATQRIFMSATLGEGGELERITGLPSISRLPMPKGWGKRNTGRRLILFPDLLPSDQKGAAVSGLLSEDRTLVVFKENRGVNSFVENNNGKIDILVARDIEDTLEKFVGSTRPTVLLLANRYDGIDLPGDSCRRMMIVGLPVSTDLQEKFFYNRMLACSQLRDLIRTRITQGVGRCTRDENDFSIVLLYGTDLLKWCCTKSNIAGMNPELQAEIIFGLDNSATKDAGHYLKLFKAFLNQDTDWLEANESIKEERDRLEKVKDDTTSVLEASVRAEVDYMYALWGQDYERAYDLANRVTEILSGGKELKPYRAYWHYASASVAYMCFRIDNQQHWKHVYEDHLRRAVSSTHGVIWISELKYLIGESEVGGVEPAFDTSAIIGLLEEWHVVGEKFHKEIKAATANINSNDASSFESGLHTLGRMLGCDCRRFKENGAPDGVWIFSDNSCLIFEAKSDEAANDAISLTTVRQALTHEKWLEAKGVLKYTPSRRTVLVTPRTTIEKDAKAVAENLYYVLIDDIRTLFVEVTDVLTSLRSKCRDIPDELMGELITSEYTKYKIDQETIFTRLTSKLVSSLNLK